ncbi:methanogenesis marker 7 protein [Methanoregula formicica]|uniref:Putative methanogenesis marker protein 7 n=1 Tax=Methanoregula formicica (strain DSM 22288 / NBRC 105244 / SMSP) TaxID=593750 RepID=L0HBA8_METFS|nr:methanogenesis marker 7 protein [Methanoregula formicica]AGB01290.1 putative methanogenesis marker protein 7 [Methanoregula formicica SMSP]
MTLVPVTYKGGIYQHDIVVDLIEDLGGYIVQKHIIAQEVVLQCFVPREDIELIRQISRPLFGEVTDSPLVGTEIAIVSMSLEIHHLPHPSCDIAEYVRRLGAKSNMVSLARGPGKRIAGLNDEERDVINEHDIAVYLMGNFETCIEYKMPTLRRGIEVPIVLCGGPDKEVLERIISPPVDGYVGNVGRFMRRTKEADELAKLDEIIAEITRVLEKKREEIAKDPLSVYPARLMGLIREQIPEILHVTSPTPLTVQMAGLRVKLPYDTFAEKVKKVTIEDGIMLGEVAEVLPSRMRDYIIVRVLPFSETNIAV